MKGDRPKGRVLRGTNIEQYRVTHCVLTLVGYQYTSKFAHICSWDPSWDAQSFSGLQKVWRVLRWELYFFAQLSSEWKHNLCRVVKLMNYNDSAQLLLCSFMNGTGEQIPKAFVWEKKSFVWKIYSMHPLWVFSPQIIYLLLNPRCVWFNHVHMLDLAGRGPNKTQDCFAITRRKGHDSTSHIYAS